MSSIGFIEALYAGTLSSSCREVSMSGGGARDGATGGARGSVLDSLKESADSALLFFGGGDDISSNMGKKGFSET